MSQKEVFISVLNHHTYNLGKKPDVKCDESYKWGSEKSEINMDSDKKVTVAVV